MNADETLEEVLAALQHEGWQEAEVFHKKGRSRTLRYSPQASVTSLHGEEGWAVRAGDRRRSFFYASTGSPVPQSSWPEADGQGIRLPSAHPVPRWSPPSRFDAALLGESEGQSFFAGLARQLDHEFPGASILTGRLDDGSSESRLINSRAVTAKVRHRAAALHVEATGPGRDTPSVQLTAVESDARRFSPAAIARRLADQLSLVEKGSPPHRDRGEFLLSPEIVISLLNCLSRLWTGPEATQISAQFTHRGNLGSRPLTLIDNGRFPGGLFETPVDGEGRPTGATTLIDEGRFKQPLLAWWQTLSRPNLASGCSFRPGWRDLPQPGNTHLYLQPDSANSVASLLENLSRGYYLLAPEGAPLIEKGMQRLALPVNGFAIEKGHPTGSVTGAWLVGSVSAFLNGLVAVARDLTFQMSGNGAVGAPTVLVKGLELRHQP